MKKLLTLFACLLLALPAHAGGRQSQSIPIPVPIAYGGTGVSTAIWAATSLVLGGATIGTDALAWTGTATGSGRLTVGGLTNTFSGSASVAASLWTGTVLTGGSATTNFPAMFVQPTGTTAVTSWSTSGTGLGMNLASGFAGNFIDFHAAGAASVFSVTSTGALNASGGITTTGQIVQSGSQSSIVIQNNGSYNFNGRGILTSPTAGSIQLGSFDNDLNSAIVAQTLRSQGALTGGTSDQAGKNFTVIVSPGKGTGAGGSFIVQTAPAGSTGTALNAPVTALTIDSTKLATMAGNATIAGATITLSNAAFTTCTALTTASNVLTCTVSDRTMKENIVDLSLRQATQFVRDSDAKVYSFRKNTPWYDNGRERIGLIAQDVQKTLPLAVFPSGKGQPLQVDDKAVLSATVMVVKDLLARVEKLEAANDNLKIQVAKLGFLRGK